MENDSFSNVFGHLSLSLCFVAVIAKAIISKEEELSTLSY
jgi:hypothetical protein